MTKQTWIEHQVGEIEDGIQQCIFCSEIITDYRGAVTPSDGIKPRALKGFAAGPVYVLPGNPRQTMTPDPRPEHYVKHCTFK
jgi:hypothetical protein